MASRTCAVIPDFNAPMEEQKVIEIPVWVDGTPKWVTGLTKRTTCDDVIYALIYNEGLHEHETTEKYTIYERWRDVERPLQARTKIIKIWRAWGAEQCNVQLTLKHNDQPDYFGEFLHNRRRHRRTRHKRSERHSKTRPVEKEYQSSRLKSMEQLAKVVISQEKKLHDIIHRIEDTDKHIDGIETNLHYTRMAENGEDYLQNAYLDTELEDSMEEFLRDVDPENIDMYIQFCERVINIEQKLETEESRIEELSGKISDDSKTQTCNNDLESELARLQVELNRIVSANMMQKYQAAEITKEIDYYDKTLTDKQELIKNLQRELEGLERTDSDYLTVVGDQYVATTRRQTSPSPLSPNKHYKDQKESEYVNISSIISFSDDVTEVTSLSDTTRDTGRGDSFDSRDSNRKNVSDLDDSFSVDTDNTSNDSQFGMGSCLKHSSPIDKYSCRTYPVYNEEPSMQCDELISERIKSEIYMYKSARVCYKSATYGNVRSDGRYNCSKPLEDNDSNSDTGLSSMHSDESPCFLETLV